MDVDLVAVGARVRAARDRAGLSQRDVGAVADIAQSKLHRVESGQRTNVTLADYDRLAQALGVGLDELLYGSAVEERVLAAARTSARTRGCTEDDLRAALEHGIELLKLDDRLDAVVPHLHQEPTRSMPTISAEGSPRERGKAAAEQVRSTLGFDVAPIADLVEALEHLTGVDIGTMPLPAGVSGVCATDPARATSVVLVNSADVLERQRFTLAHELGHLLFGDATHVDALNCQRSPQEVLCDEFARQLLIPFGGVRSWLRRTVGTVDKAQVDERVMALIARHFGVSPEATRIQLDRMGLLPSLLADIDLPSGRRWAYRYGWGPQFDSDQAAARQPRAPRRMLDRATEAYRAGKLGVGVLARLQDRPVAKVEQALAEAGVLVEPAVRRADVGALVARAAARGSTTSRPVS
ncbi:MAG TPA: XRE family transcriptional regulator [Pseudonocardiaceae bacterium]|jgi:Zn-dependent peptidase ImmA (M78 family)/transcriptional regulator with XRE-family HTH domain|nr:XRE family transcriptional regulator [Pseudonocardiaceae bacterium]